MLSESLNFLLELKYFAAMFLASSTMMMPLVMTSVSVLFFHDFDIAQCTKTYYDFDHRKRDLHY